MKYTVISCLWGQYWADIDLYEFDQPAFFTLENIGKYHQYLVCGGQLSILSFYIDRCDVLCSMDMDCVLSANQHSQRGTPLS